jgi:hypothetical protein
MDELVGKLKLAIRDLFGVMLSWKGLFGAVLPTAALYFDDALVHSLEAFVMALGNVIFRAPNYENLWNEPGKLSVLVDAYRLVKMFQTSYIFYYVKAAGFLALAQQWLLPLVQKKEGV